MKKEMKLEIKNKIAKKKFNVVLSLTVIIVLLLLMFVFPQNFNFSSNPEQIKDFILKYDYFAPLIYILLHILQAIFVIIPLSVLSIAGGFVFGPWMGTIYGVIGGFIGSSLGYYLGKKYGKKFILMYINEKKLKNFQARLHYRRRETLFLCRIIPIIPNNLISFISGFTTISLKEYNLFSTLGLIWNIGFFTFFGAELAKGHFKLLFITIIVIIIIGVLIKTSKKKKVLPPP